MTPHAPTAPGAAPVEDDWTRLHPLSPVLRGGRFLTAAVAVLVTQGLRDPGLLSALVGGGTVGAVLLGLLAWRTTRYRVTATELQVRSGLLQRRDRRVPLARLQSVDVVRPLVARLLGLTELRLEVAGGGREA